MMKRALLTSPFPRKRESVEGGASEFIGCVTVDSRFRRNAEEGAGREEQGFTLIELMVVLLILSLLATVVVINVMPAQDRAMAEKARTDIALLEQAAERYRLDMFAYPPGEAGLQALVQAPAGLAHPERYPAGGYIKRLPDDPWGNPYHYQAPGRHGAIDIYSFGADNREGGEGQDADIGNWK